MQKIAFKKLKSFLAVAFAALILAPTLNYVYVTPKLRNSTIEQTQATAQGIANHLAHGIKPGHDGITMQSIDHEALLEEVSSFKVWKTKVFSSGGEVVFSTDRADVGSENKNKYFTDIVAKGRPFSHFVQKNTNSLDGGKVFIDIVETYVPIMQGNRFVGAFEIYYDVTSEIERINTITRKSNLLFFITTALLLTISWLYFRSAKHAVKGLARTEVELSHSKEKLEYEVEQRTWQLREANQSLLEEIAERINAEAAISKSLEEKTMLVKELDHRVKNNMQVIMSLLSLQGNHLSEGKGRKAFSQALGRIRSMSLAHEEVYTTENSLKVSVRSYFCKLRETVLRSSSADSSSVTINADIKNANLAIDKAVPLGLLMNELLMDALNHALTNDNEGEISVYFGTTESGDYELKISDNGSAIDEGIRPAPLSVTLVRALADQLGGEIHFTDASPGTSVSAQFPA